MDSLTHIALGGCIGEAFFKEKDFGKKAMLWGALAQSIPDIDFISTFWMSTPGSLLAHRGITHSIFFVVLVTPILAFIAQRIHYRRKIPLRKWLLFFAIEILVHLFIDGFNNYGIGWLEPFSPARFSFNAIYVADPLFSIWPIIAFVVLFILKPYHKKRRFWWRFGIIIPSLYLGYCTINKIKIDHDVKENFITQNIPHERYFTTPAPLQNWLWYVVSGNDSGYYVGFRSLFDSERHIDFEYFPRNDSLLEGIDDHEDLQRLIRFSEKFYTVEKYNDTLVLNDLRFGQIIGWHDPKEQFVFHYYLQYPDDNVMVVQRGRFAKWDKEVVKSLWTRMKGN